MAARALRRSLWLVAGVALVSRADAAYSSAGTYEAESKRYGKNTITTPDLFYAVKVDARGAVSKLAGATLTVKHEEGGIGCHKTQSVSAGFHGFDHVKHTNNLAPGTVHPNLCTFTQTFTSAYPLVGTYREPDERAALTKACRARPAGVDRIVVPHPLFEWTYVTLWYGSGGQVIGGWGFDSIRYPPPKIAITCEPCPAITFQKRVVRMRADQQQTFDVATLVQGGLPPLTYTLGNVPTGMVKQGSLLTGRPIAGTYLSTMTVNGTCATGASTAKDGVQFIVEHAPIVLASQTATPSSLSKDGGAVKLEAKVTSQQLVVTAVRAKAVLAGKTSTVPLGLTSGTNKNGTWSAVWQVPPNGTTEWLKYGVLFEATDGDGKTTLITGNNMIEVKVAPLPSKPPAAPAPTSTGPIPKAPPTPPAPTTKPTSTAPPVVPKLPPS